MNSHRHKTVYNKSSTVQWYDGILHPQESQREGKKDKNKDVGTVSYPSQMCQYFFFNMSRYFTATCHVQSCVYDKTAKCFLNGVVIHIEICLHLR